MKKFNRFKNTLSKKIVITGILSSLICVLSSVVGFLIALNNLSYTLLIINVLVAVSSIIFLFFINYNTIIQTSEKIELAVGEIEKHNTDKILNFDSSKEQITDALSQILDRIKESTSREYLIKSLEQRSAFAELQSQINPHFLYNTLESIRGQALIDGNTIVAEMTETLAKYFRYSINKSNDYDLVPLEKELQNANNYIKIQKYRFEDRFNYEVKFRCNKNECLDCKIPKMTLQPIIENSVLHGLESTEEQGLITINIELTDKRLIIQVSDNGSGIEKEILKNINNKLKNSDDDTENTQDSAHNGIALKNVNERIKLAFGNEYGIVVSSTLNIGTEITLTFPIIK